MASAITFLKISPLVMTLGMAGVVSGLILVVTQGNVSGSVAPIMTQLIARPVFLGHSRRDRDLDHLRRC